MGIMRSVQIFLWKNGMIIFMIIITVTSQFGSLCFVLRSDPILAYVNKKRRAKEARKKKWDRFTPTRAPATDASI